MSEPRRDKGDDVTEPIERIVATDGHEGYWFTGEEIVRCRDCEHIFTEGLTVPWCDANQMEVEPDGYCAWGERMDA